MSGGARSGSGKKRLSDGVKKLRGTDQPCRMSGDTELAPLDFLPEPPDYLTKEGKDFYNDLGNRLFHHGVINEFNVETFVILVSEISLYIKSMKLVNRQGSVIGKMKPEINPNRKIAENAFKNIKSFCVEFGMTPSSFIKMAAIINQNKPKNPYEQFKHSGNSS